jgi:hypothetical protein
VRLLCAFVLTVAWSVGCRRSAAWRGEQETLIAHAIVQDLVEIPGDEGTPKPTAFCVYGWHVALHSLARARRLDCGHRPRRQDLLKVRADRSTRCRLTARDWEDELARITARF